MAILSFQKHCSWKGTTELPTVTERNTFAVPPLKRPANGNSFRFGGMALFSGLPGALEIYLLLLLSK